MDIPQQLSTVVPQTRVEELFVKYSKTAKDLKEACFFDLVHIYKYTDVQNLCILYAYCVWLEENIPEANESIPSNTIVDFSVKELDLMKEYSGQEITSLIKTANYMNMQRLLHLLAKVVSLKIKTVERSEIQKYFAIEDDFTEEEISVLETEHPWIQECGIDLRK